MVRTTQTSCMAGDVVDDYEGCGECGKPQWSCNCWESEAGKWVAGRAESQANLERLRDEAYGAENNPGCIG